MRREPDAQSNNGIKCPHCGTEVTDLTDYGSCVTYWGADGDDPVEIDCEGCDETFYVIERVTRWWKSFKNDPTKESMS